jgi:hypothetical protein
MRRSTSSMFPFTTAYITRLMMVEYPFSPSRLYSYEKYVTAPMASKSSYGSRVLYLRTIRSVSMYI